MPSGPTAIAFTALLVALSGTAVALPGTNRVDSGDIKNSTIRGKDIRNGAVGTADVKNNGLTGTDVAESTLSKVPSATSADSAANAANATNATNATNAGNAGALGGQPASAFARSEQPAFTAATLGAGYTQFPGGHQTVGFMKDTLGFVHLRGTMNCPASGTAFTLPAGFRPAATEFGPIPVGGAAGGNVQVNSAGNVDTFIPTGAAPCGVGGFTFKASP